MRLRKAMTESMSDSWNRSTMSAKGEVLVSLEGVGSCEGRRDVPAQAIWKRFSFSNFLKTAGEFQASQVLSRKGSSGRNVDAQPLISTIWLLTRSVSRALSYELMATLSEMSWKKKTRVCATTAAADFSVNKLLEN